MPLPVWAPISQTFKLFFQICPPGGLLGRPEAPGGLILPGGGSKKVGSGRAVESRNLEQDWKESLEVHIWSVGGRNFLWAGRRCSWRRRRFLRAKLGVPEGLSPRKEQTSSSTSFTPLEIRGVGGTTSARQVQLSLCRYCARQNCAKRGRACHRPWLSAKS